MSKTFEYYVLKIALYFALYFTYMSSDTFEKINRDVNSSYGNSNNYDED